LRHFRDLHVKRLGQRDLVLGLIGNTARFIFRTAMVMVPAGRRLKVMPMELVKLFSMGLVHFLPPSGTTTTLFCASARDIDRQKTKATARCTNNFISISPRIWWKRQKPHKTRKMRKRNGRVFREKNYYTLPQVYGFGGKGFKQGCHPAISTCRKKWELDVHRNST
jgi:hypothetical protein